VQGQTRLRRIADESGESDAEDLLDPAATVAAPQHSPAMGEAQRRIVSTALQMALRTLSQKTVVALANLFSLLLAGSVFWVFLTILAEPTVLQLVGAGMFAVFVLSLHLVRKR